MKQKIVAIALCCLCLTSCIKEEAQNKECDIESAWIEGEAYEQYFYKTTEMRKEAISSTETDIVFSVRSLISLGSSIPVNFKITEGATIEPASGSMQDFTKGPVTYTVTSQDGEWKRKYNVIFKEASLPVEKFSFENVEVLKETTLLGTNEMHVFYEKTSEGKPNYCWATGNLGASILSYGKKPEEFPTYSVPDGKEGKGVCLTTLSSGKMGEALKKPIAPGSMFLGKFVVDYVLSDVMKSTLFGLPNSKEPVRITGWYKYQPGEKFTDKNMKTIEGRIDLASIYAVFYRNTDDAGNSYVLDGHAVADLDKLMDNPQIYKVARVASLPPTDTWTQWEMFFEGRDVPADIIAAQGCNLALVFASSRDGILFEGAIGSTLYVDEIQISYER